jgi:hypothetical protein
MLNDIEGFQIEFKMLNPIEGDSDWVKREDQLFKENFGNIIKK